MSKILKLAEVSLLALALLVGMAIPTLAAPDSSSSWVDDFNGAFLTAEVLSIGDQEFVILSGEEELAIAVNDDTLYYQLSAPDRVRTWLRQRLQVRQQYQEEIRTQEGNGQGQGQGFQNRMRVEVATCSQLRLQNQLAQMEGTLQTEILCCRWLQNFGEETEFADISVGDSVVVWLIEDTNLAQGVMIIEPTD